ncbi:MAG TPA: glycosyltransferase family 8 protein [Rhodoblastus sp.]|nr:glycosyltransferase family 8 protein [Rhodoblastus sp.]
MIQIACCFDRRFEILFLILAQSIARHTRSDVTIHALHDGPVPLAKDCAPRTENLRVEFQDIGARYDKIDVNGPQSVVTYARFALPDILAGIDRILYLDVDMLTRRDLTPLWETDLQGKALGAVVDHSLVDVLPYLGIDFGPAGKTRPSKNYVTDIVGMADWKRYFNAGLLLIDTPALAASGRIDKARAFLREKGAVAINNDQDALNHAFDGDYKVLGPEWNCIANFSRTLGEDFAGCPGLREAWRDPAIAHYAGAKPWQSHAAENDLQRAYWAAARDAHMQVELLKLALKDAGERPDSNCRHDLGIVARRVVSSYFD